MAATKTTQPKAPVKKSSAKKTDTKPIKTKPPIKKAKSAPKLAKTTPRDDEDAHVITVTVKKPTTVGPGPIAIEEDIPEKDLPTADELDLSLTDDPSNMSTEQMEQWFDDLDTVDESSGDLAEQAANEGLSQAEIDYKKKHPIEDEMDEQIKKPIESLVKPSPMSQAAEDGGKLKGFIVGHARGARTEAAVVHQSAQTARDALQSPKVFDTSVVFQPINPSVALDEGRSYGWLWVLFTVLLLAAVAAYALIDLGLIKVNFGLPFDILGALLQ